MSTLPTYFDRKSGHFQNDTLLCLSIKLYLIEILNQRECSIIREFGIRNYRYNKQIVDMFLCSKLSVGNCHSAEKRNPVYATSIIIYIHDVFWIPLFSGMTVTNRPFEVG